jgi:uncharacterized membrane protein YjjB (DUF3815 family)
MHLYWHWSSLLIYWSINYLAHLLYMVWFKSWSGPSWSWFYGSWIYNYLCNQYLTLWVRIPLRRYNILW